MHVIVYAAKSNEELPNGVRASYRNPAYWKGEVEGCDAVIAEGAKAKDILAAYKKAGIDSYSPDDAPEPDEPDEVDEMSDDELQDFLKEKGIPTRSNFTRETLLKKVRAVKRQEKEE